jgi:hypothetical protein
MKEFQQKMQERFDQMCQTGKLFRSEVSSSRLWDIYLKSFENDPVFRDPSSTFHNCNLCNNFLRRYGNIVAIDSNYEIMSIFDFEIEGEYAETAKLLSAELRKSAVKDVFFETFQELNSLPYEVCKKSNTHFKLGIDKNLKKYTQEEADKYPGTVNVHKIYTFEHMFLLLPAQFVDMSGRSVESIMGDFRSDFEVFERAMIEIPTDTYQLVKELIGQGSLLNGETYLSKVVSMADYKKKYEAVGSNQKRNWCWVNSFKLPYAKFKNELIGTFCTELAEGKELNEACQTWNKRVDPANYMKAVAPITEAQRKAAQKFVEDNGYENSFNRRFATLEDIRVSEILHVNAGDGKVKAGSIFDQVKVAKSTRHKRSELDKVDEVTIEKFMADILPNASSVEVLFENRHEGNLCVMTAPVDPTAKPIFKWGNGFSWTYNGNLAGKSMLREEVSKRGGNVTGVLRFSLSWNESGKDSSDLDLWVNDPASLIGFSTSYRKDRGNTPNPCSGILDLDIIQPSGKLAVENIAYSTKSKMKDGVYKCWVNPYSRSNSQGFKAEMEVDGQLYQYSYPQSVSKNIDVCTVYIKGGNVEKIDHHLPHTEDNKEIWGVETNDFHKVNLICLSPNFWDDKVGHKHYFFMMEDCKCPDSMRTFHNENLNAELTAHRKVLDVLGANCSVAPTEKHLAGVGFNATVKDSVIVRVKGTFNRMLKITF